MKKQQIKSAISVTVVGLLSPLALMVPSVSAATVTWDGSADESWANTANWDGATAPSNTDTVEFPATSEYDISSATVRTTENDLSSLTLSKILFNGAVSLSSTSFTVTGNGLTLTSAIEAVMTGTGGDHQVLTDVTLAADATFKTSGSNSLQVGDDGTTLALGTNDLTLDASGGTITIAGEVTGSGAISIAGSKVKYLSDMTAYTGATTLSSGELTLTDESSGNYVISGGTLKGTSDLLGDVTMSSGTIAPGNSPGCLGTADLTFTGGNYNVEIGGKTVCTEYDSTTVIGAVNLGSATTLNLSVINGFAPAVNDTFAIITNDSTDKTNGTFASLSDGDKVTVSGYTFEVHYNAGEEANDVVLRVTGTPTAPDTGVGSIISNPILTMIAAVAALSVVGGLKFADSKKRK